MMASVIALEPFAVDVPPSVLTDLAERLRRTRFPNEIAGIGWQQGMPLDDLREVVRYWLDAYDWRVHEARLNRYQQFITTVDGQRIHFLHIRSRHLGAVPLFLTHGWPGSVVEFLDVIDLLADPADSSDAFHLVVPSLPGYGFSGPTTEAGWNPRRIAAAFGQIADRLGYQRYGVQGGDWGAIVSANMAELRPDRADGGPALTMDQLLTNVMLYWVNRTGASSARLYWERRQAPETMVPRRPVTVPTGVANYPGELIRSLRPHAEQFFNIVHWSEPPRGGHFPAMEVPDLFVADVRSFFRPLR
jgi:pimeloyl-ACP methyl ester carboxylesterase